MIEDNFSEKIYVGDTNAEMLSYSWQDRSKVQYRKESWDPGTWNPWEYRLNRKQYNKNYHYNTESSVLPV